MSTNILFLAHVDESGANLPKAAYDALGAASEATTQLSGTLAVGLIGENVHSAAQDIAAAAAKIFIVQGPDFAQPRYASDAAAVEAICRAASPQIVIAPHTSRFARVLPGVAQRLKGSVDTHISALEIADGALTAKRWLYRQRIEASLQRDARPWILLLDAGCHQPWSGAPAQPNLQLLDVPLPPETTRTKFIGIRTPRSGAQTIRPDAHLLFVAGAGWTKKQSDGKTHPAEAESLILQFLQNSGASLGGSKSLVDQSGENQEVLLFMTHLNQVGQTGSTPRHPKGLSACCHGEEPHVVGWRFINERRAINLDPNCGWARGKADVLYVADAFQVLAKLNSLLQAKQNQKEPAPATV